jgi:Flp pilus assembly pilin Flp
MEMKILVAKLWKDETGQDLTEYALLMTLVALGATAAMSNFSLAISKTFSSAASNLGTTT